MKNYNLNEPSRIFSGDDFQGTSIVYAATPYTLIGMQCDYLVRTLEDSFPTETRGHRKALIADGKSVPALGKDRLHSELMVVVGPEMSADDVIVALRLIVSDIRANGLQISNTAEQGVEYEFPESVK